VIALAACGSGGGEDAATSTSEVATTAVERSTTTEAPTPEEAFLTAVDDRMSFGGSGGPEAALETAIAVCDSFDTIVETGASDDFTRAALDIVVEQSELDAEVFDVVLDLATTHLCPEHRELYERTAATPTTTEAPERLEHWRTVARESTCAELADLEAIKLQNPTGDALVALTAIHERQAEVHCPQ
jgi:hypothetical protein